MDESESFWRTESKDFSHRDESESPSLIAFSTQGDAEDLAHLSSNHHAESSPKNGLLELRDMAHLCTDVLAALLHHFISCHLDSKQPGCRSECLWVKMAYFKWPTSGWFCDFASLKWMVMLIDTVALSRYYISHSEWVTAEWGNLQWFTSACWLHLLASPCNIWSRNKWMKKTNRWINGWVDRGLKKMITYYAVVQMSSVTSD